MSRKHNKRHGVVLKKIFTRSNYSIEKNFCIIFFLYIIINIYTGKTKNSNQFRKNPFQPLKIKFESGEPFSVLAGVFFPSLAITSTTSPFILFSDSFPTSWPNSFLARKYSMQIPPSSRGFLSFFLQHWSSLIPHAPTVIPCSHSHQSQLNNTFTYAACNTFTFGQPTPSP